MDKLNTNKYGLKLLLGKNHVLNFKSGYTDLFQDLSTLWSSWKY